MAQATIFSLAANSNQIRDDYTGFYSATKPIQPFPLIVPPPAELDADYTALSSDLLLSKEAFQEAAVALATGKHLILYGPPGTGKTSLAKKLAKIFNCTSELETATADWSTYDTIGGLRVSAVAGREGLTPFDGVLVKAIVQCCNQVGMHRMAVLDNQQDLPKQAHWLVIDELNRAKMDAAFGQLFTALDDPEAKIQLPHYHDEPTNQEIYPPQRFRLIGTMNNYDKNFLFKLSYALTRRFAFIYIGAPAEGQFQSEQAIVKARVMDELEKRLNKTVPTVADFDNAYGAAITPIAAVIKRLRYPAEEKDVMREIGTAQFKDACRHAVFGMEQAGWSEADAADRAVAAHIVPQLEGLGTRLASLAEDPAFTNLAETCKALKRSAKPSF